MGISNDARVGAHLPSLGGGAGGGGFKNSMSEANTLSPRVVAGGHIKIRINFRKGMIRIFPAKFVRQSPSSRRGGQGEVSKIA